MVPEGQNLSAGGQLGTFYDDARVLSGDEFFVDVPLGEDITWSDYPPQRGYVGPSES